MTARNAALQTLVHISHEQAFSNLEVNKVINNDSVKEKDKNLYVNLVYGTLQHKLTIDYILRQYIQKGFNKFKQELKWALRIAVYQILYLDKTPDYAIVNETVEQVKKIDKSKADLVNAVLRNILRNKDEIEEELKNLNDYSLEFSVPEWIINKYKETYKKDTRNILEEINNNPLLTLRVKPENLELIFNSLEKLGAQPKKSENELIADSVILVEKPSAITKGINNSKAYKKGLVSIQDQGAIEIGKVLDPKPGELVLDLCAAPGGKTNHIAEMMDGKGKVIACDIYDSRLSLIDKTAKRLGNDKIIETFLQDGTKFNPTFENRFDKILVDAPCSGLGIIKRKPDIRYRVSEQDSKDLSKVQKEILENAFKYLKPGGQLVYSTCTVGTQENEEVVEAVRENFSDQFKVLKEEHTNPLEDRGDSFYYAKIEKV